MFGLASKIIFNMGDAKARHSTEVHRDFVSQTPEYQRRRSLSIQPVGADIGTGLSVSLDPCAV